MTRRQSERRAAAFERERQKPIAVPGYVDSTVLMTKMQRPPFVESTIPGDAQIHRIALQLGQGRRVRERLFVEVCIGGARVAHFAARVVLTKGVSGFIVDQFVVKPGEIVSVETKLEEASRWWRRLIDSCWDWWSPPKVRVIVSGVVRETATVEA